MLCPACNKEIGTGISFCPYCGTAIEKKVVYVPVYNRDSTYEERRTATIIAAIGCVLLVIGGFPISIILGYISWGKAKTGLLKIKKGSTEWQSWKTVDTLASISFYGGIILCVIFIIFIFCMLIFLNQFKHSI